jgi:hypothetical protein
VARVPAGEHILFQKFDLQRDFQALSLAAREMLIAMDDQLL